MIFTSVCPTVYTVCRVVEEEWHPSEKTATDDSILEWDEIRYFAHINRVDNMIPQVLIH